MYEAGLRLFGALSAVYGEGRSDTGSQQGLRDRITPNSQTFFQYSTPASHKRFEEKYGLAFTLLSDPERTVIEAYDVWKEKKNYGKVSMGVVRTTYLIDEDGIIIRANDKVKAADDAEKMLGEME